MQIPRFTYGPRKVKSVTVYAGTLHFQSFLGESLYSKEPSFPQPYSHSRKSGFLSPLLCGLCFLSLLPICLQHQSPCFQIRQTNRHCHPLSYLTSQLPLIKLLAPSIWKPLGAALSRLSSYLRLCFIQDPGSCSSLTMVGKVDQAVQFCGSTHSVCVCSIHNHKQLLQLSVWCALHQTELLLQIYSACGHPSFDISEHSRDSR